MIADELGRITVLMPPCSSNELPTKYVFNSIAGAYGHEAFHGRGCTFYPNGSDRLRSPSEALSVRTINVRVY